MSVVVNEVRKGFYLDSVALMRLARQAQDIAGVADAGLMIGTPANLQILRDAGLLDATGAAAGPGDLVIALRAADTATARAAIDQVRAELDRPRRAAATGSSYTPRTLKGALAADPAASLALISVPGDFAAAEATAALTQGLNVMIFSDNVPLADEIALKNLGRERGLLVMGPDCGTAIIAGLPLAFANAVPRGDIGLVGASGTGIQEISCLIAAAGGGISHAIGTGGRDLSAAVGAITTLMAIEALAADAGTRTIVLVSKPPEPAVAQRVLHALAETGKPAIVCFLGATGLSLPAGCQIAPTLEDAARLAAGDLPGTAPALPGTRRPGQLIRGLFAGGTMCSEAQVVFRTAGMAVASNVPIPGAAKLAGSTDGHVLVDLGDDAFTRGRPHPMIEPAVRDEPLRAAMADPRVGVVLVDVVLGTGGHLDPAGHLADVVSRSRTAGGPEVVASITGTEQDPQIRSAQVARLEAAQVIVARSNAEAARLALALVRSGPM
ncbi:MAG: acyl-CoA synthetase FdrA [Hyphomicrobiaceae bacterium]